MTTRKKVINLNKLLRKGARELGVFEAPEAAAKALRGVGKPPIFSQGYCQSVRFLSHHNRPRSKQKIRCLTCFAVRSCVVIRSQPIFASFVSAFSVCVVIFVFETTISDEMSIFYFLQSLRTNLAHLVLGHEKWREGCGYYCEGKAENQSHWPNQSEN
ncbi:hypothetical protein BDZ45DRAFT_755911 [Acephala macrosclerotiorum]|nr:hypothetical protein BDZ45DRAFT_755911 [Acephala macrosclerotiorum]